MVSVPFEVAEFMFCKNLENLLEDGGPLVKGGAVKVFPLPAVG
jgi:hypothetical protein